MFSIGIRSRIGNVVLVVLGATYTVAGALLAVWALSLFRGTDSPLAIRVYAVLAVAIGGGIFMMNAGLRNLGIHSRRRVHVQTALSH